MSAGRPPPPFAVPKPWQHALAMVSINAGLTPQALLHAYHAQQPRQAARHPDHTDLDLDADIPAPAAGDKHHHPRAARDRGVRGVRVRCDGGDPARVTLLAIAVDAVDPATGAGVVRLVTNTSVRHVLEEPCADCPLWLPVRATAAAGTGEEDKKKRERDHGSNHHDRGTTTTQTTTYQIVPCCDAWADAVDFDVPLSAEEKQVPAVVDRLLEELRARRLALLARERDLRDREDELARLRARRHQHQHHRHRHHSRQASDGEGGGGGAAAAAAAAAEATTPPVVVVEQHPRQQQHALALDAEVLAQYWWAAAMVVAFLLVIVVLK